MGPREKNWNHCSCFWADSVRMEKFSGVHNIFWGLCVSACEFMHLCVSACEFMHACVCACARKCVIKNVWVRVIRQGEHVCKRVREWMWVSVDACVRACVSACVLKPTSIVFSTGGFILIIRSEGNPVPKMLRALRPHYLASNYKGRFSPILILFFPVKI